MVYTACVCRTHVCYAPLFCPVRLRLFFAPRAELFLNGHESVFFLIRAGSAWTNCVFSSVSGRTDWGQRCDGRQLCRRWLHGVRALSGCRMGEVQQLFTYRDACAHTDIPVL